MKTPQELADFLQGKKQKIKDGIDGVTPVKGVDYFDGKDGKTPIKGVDYFDGKDGVGKPGKDGVGRKGDKGEPGYTPIKGKDYFDGKDGINPEPKEVIAEIKKLKGDERIPLNAIKGSEFLRKLGDANGGFNMKDQRWHGGGLTNVTHNTTLVGNGTTDTPLGVNPDLTLDSLQFNTAATPQPNAEGLLQWNATENTLDLGLEGGIVTGQIFEENFIRGVNKTGSTLLNGSVVYTSGRQGNKPKFTLAKGDAEATSMALGVLTMDILDNGFGRVTTFGYVRQIKTDYSGSGDWGTTWAENDKLYLSKAVAGQLTNIEPSAPHHSDCIATVAILGGVGIGAIFVNIDRHKTLEELSDVNGTPLTVDGQFPVWNNTGKYFDFTSKTGDFLNIDQTTPQTTVGRFTFPNIAVDTDLIYTDSVNNRVGIGTTAPAVKLTIQQADQVYAQNGDTGTWDMALGIAANTAKISGMDFKNFNTGGQVRLMARNDQNDYLVMNMLGSANGTTFFGQTGANAATIFLNGATDTNKILSIGTYNAGDLILGTGNTERMRILSTGNVGIGITAPVEELTVAKLNATNDSRVKILSDGSTDEMLGFANSTANNIWTIGRRNTASSLEIGYQSASVTPSVRAGQLISILTSGYTGIGVTTPTYKLDVRGTLAAHGVRSAMGFDIYQVPDPTAPTGVVSAGGSVDTGDHWYGVTYITIVGETHVKYTAAVVTTTAGNNTVTLTIPVSTDPRVTSRKIYRTKAGQAQYQEYYLATIADNTTTTYVDTTADASLTGSAGVIYFGLNKTSYNITIGGTKAMTLDTNGTFYGTNAGASITTGGRSTFIGSSSGTSFTTGVDNTGVGHSALSGSTSASGSNNTCVGVYSGRVISSGGTNTGVGGYSLFSTTTGSNNVALGSYSLRLVSTQGGNVAMGVNSGYSVASSYNTLIGNNSGYTLTTGAGNVFLGYESGFFETGSNKLFIDQSRRANEADARVKALMYGVFASTVANQTLRVNGNMEIGDVGSGNYTEFEADGTLHMIGAATVYDDIQFNISSGKVPAANAPTWSTWNGLSEYSFAVNDYIDLGSQELQHDWKEGSAVELHVHWSTGTGNYISGDRVNWQIEYTWTNMATTQPFTAFPAPTAVSAEQAFTTTVAPYSHVYTSIASFTPTGGKIGAQLKVRLKRIAKSAGGTDPATNPFALQVGLHYELDTLGSRTTGAK